MPERQKVNHDSHSTELFLINYGDNASHAVQMQGQTNKVQPKTEDVNMTKELQSGDSTMVTALTENPSNGLPCGTLFLY